ncbi:regulator of G-protein signaling 9a [Clupea harengus]|uniref:Regulator of G-protein signaling 9a n=1 Tax=Clupea harengus TaxID=7950 RepID=A0A6P3VWA1_CLUHA|nr:regulator of G-protein signaling 9a [Clupea harengus]
MTIRSNRDHAQHYRPRMTCLKKVEALVVEMQDSKSGVTATEQKLNVTTIPHVMTGQDILAWIANKMKMDAEEAQALGTMLVAYGYIYPLQDHKKLILKPDGSFFRFQTPYFWPVQKWQAEDIDYAIYLAKRNMRKKGTLEVYEQARYNEFHKWLNPKWDFIVMQATEQYRANKQRQKADRVVFDCQERAYWIVQRPPPRAHSALDCMDRLVDPNDETRTYDHYRRTTIYLQQAMARSRVKSTVSLGALVKYINTYKNHDPFLAPCTPSNPWLSEDDTYWELNLPTVEVPTKMRVERWSFSLMDLFNDPRGRKDFKLFLKKEFSGENMAFWEAAEDMVWGSAASMADQSQTIFKTFLIPGAPRWINIDGRTMGLTVKGLEHPHRYVLDAAQTHVFLLMKKDTFFRYLKSPVYKDMQKRAIVPPLHNYSDAQVEQNARNRRPGTDPILIWQQLETERKAADLAGKPVDISTIKNKIDRK